MKKAAIYFLIGALAITFNGSLALASEVTGTISTGGGQNENSSPTPTPTPNPSGSSGHSSEIGGSLGTTVGNTTVVGVVTGGENEPPRSYNWWEHQQSELNSQSNASTTEIATTSDETQDDSSAQLAILDFGPRYGIPGAPLAGGSGGITSGGGTEMSTLSVGENPLESVELAEEGETYAFVPQPVDSPVSGAELVAQSITNASGLSMAQLTLIALLGLILLGSMGYAISRAGPGALR